MKNALIGVLVTICLACDFCEAREDLRALHEECLKCICEGSSSCDSSIQCMTYGDENTGRVCGPFQITEAYWEDAGKPGGDFLSCVTTMSCAQSTVVNYMNRFGKDCDADGRVTCEDYARLHTAGVGGCDGPWVELTRFWTKYKACRKESTESWDGAVETRAMLRGS